MCQHGDRTGEKSLRGLRVFHGAFLLVLLVFPQRLHAASPRRTEAKVFCSDPGFPEHGNRTPSSGRFFEGAMARFSCVEGYRLKGPAKIVCTPFPDGSLRWRPSLTPVCLLEECVPPHIEDAEVENRTYRPRDFLGVRCHAGFQIRYPDMDHMRSVCQEDGAWDNQPICQGCSRPLTPLHSYMNLSEAALSVPVGTVVLYHCYPGYKLEGAAMLECTSNLIWSGAPPRCLDVEVCSLPPMVEHGDYLCHPQPCDRFIHGTVVEFLCDPGYHLDNDYLYITCQNGRWLPPAQFHCISDETAGLEESLVNTWWAVAFTACGVMMGLLLLLTGKLLHLKCRIFWSPSVAPQDSGGPDVLVVDGVPVPLPSYEEAVGSCNLPDVWHPGGPADSLRPEARDQPPSYPGHVDVPSRGASDTRETETCGGVSDTPSRAQSSQPPPSGAAGLNGAAAKSASSVEETVSTSPSIHIAYETPLMEDEAAAC